jgi:hypothetical protein
VAGGDGVVAACERLGQEQVELHHPVAHHVRIGRAAGGVLVDHVADHALAVLRLEIEGHERDAERRGDAQRVLALLLPAAAAGARIGVVRPVLHERAGDLVPLGHEQSRGDARVDAAGHGDQDLLLGAGHNDATYHGSRSGTRLGSEQKRKR